MKHIVILSLMAITSLTMQAQEKNVKELAEAISAIFRLLRSSQKYLPIQRLHLGQEPKRTTGLNLLA